MVAERKSREMVRQFIKAGWTPGPSKGTSHTKWYCPCGRHQFTLPDGHKTISPGVVQKADKALGECHK